MRSAASRRLAPLRSLSPVFGGPERSAGGGKASDGHQMTAQETTTLYRPVGPRELELIEASGFRAFPPRLPEQPIFYPVLSFEYAAQIARDWNAKDAPRATVASSRASWLRRRS